MSFTTLSSQRTVGVENFETITIDRDPGALGPYVLVRYSMDLQIASRSGIVTSIRVPEDNVYFARVDPISGSYLVIDNNSSGGFLRFVSKDFRNVTLLRPGNSAKDGAFPHVAAFARDGTMWVASAQGSQQQLYLHNITRDGKRLKTIPLSGLSASPWGLEIFGSRPLVCSLPPASNRVTVRVQSQHPMVAPNQTQYVLAASFARRPGVRMPNGEWLNLNVVSDPLFYASVSNGLPTIFKNFQGVVGNNFKATATVDIPPLLRKSGITIFVAGILMNQGQVIEVTNTHWFVL